MPEQSEVVVTTVPSSTGKRSGLLDGVRQLTYAWVGVWGVASDDIGNFYSRCVARGEQLLNARPPATRPEVNTVVSQPIAAAAGRGGPVSWINAFVVVKPSRIDLNVEGGLPTKAEFDALIERVEALSGEVDALVDRRKQEQ